MTEILARVRQEGDAALVEYCRRFDCPVMDLAQLRVSPEEFALAEQQVDDAFRTTLKLAADRIRHFHERELEDSWMLTREDGTITGRLVRPVDSAGLYVPGGKQGSTPLVSSVLIRITSYNVCYTKLLRMFPGKRAKGRPSFPLPLVPLLPTSEARSGNP